MRYELKYRLDALDFEGALAAVLMHPASFTKAYEDRRVNNIYLDSPSFHCFHQNVEGQPYRKKMRLRWYGEHDFPNKESVLEVKIKEKELGWKVLHPVNESIKDATSLLHTISKLGLYQGDLIPTLQNTYLRSYYISSDGLFRITIDREQTFTIPFSGMSPIAMDEHPVIVEVKFDKEVVTLAKEVTDYLPFRVSKNSKYTTGIEYLYL